MDGAIGKLLVGWGPEGNLQTSLYFSMLSSMPCEMLEIFLDFPVVEVRLETILKYWSLDMEAILICFI